MRALWLEQAERGNIYAMRAIIYIARVLGRRASRLLLYPICLYFLIFSFRARRASRQYLEKALPYPVGTRDIFRHYFYFASSILDRIFWLSGNYAAFDFQFQIAPEAEQTLLKGGCLLLGSHLGSFELMRILGEEHRGLVINILMFRENAAMINAVMRKVNPHLFPKIIDMDEPLALLRVKECLERGEIIGMLGDRILPRDKTTSCDFLGQPAYFPTGAFQLAASLDVPIVLGFGLYEGGNTYTIYLEVFPRTGDSATQTCYYVQRLANHCLHSPYNWFNFYDIWHTET